METRKMPDLISHEHIKELLELSNSNIMREMVDPVKHALEIFENNISRLIFLPDIPRLEFRYETIRILLDHISNEVKGGQYSLVMRNAGKAIGKSLGNDMIMFLMGNNKLPKDYELLMVLWNEWDLISGWGKRIYDADGKEITIVIDDSFLTRGGGDSKHKHCAFFEGYAFGFLWTIIKEQYRWFKRAVTQPSHKLMEPVEVTEKSHGDKCKFVVKLKEEELNGAFDALSDAKDCLRNKDCAKCANHIRTSIELAFKEKIGVGGKEKTPLMKILKSLKQRNMQLKFRTIDDIYASTSVSIHGTGKAEGDSCWKMIEKWDDILESLELMQLPEKDKQEIRNEVMNGYSETSK